MPNTPNDTTSTFYVTTPIYYVNDRPHIGHAYTTLLADTLARYHRLNGDDVFFLTGTDEHADKVAKAAKEHGKSFIEWADTNANAFKDAFKELGFTNDDFVRTTEDRHKVKVSEFIKKLMDSGDVYLGDYSGWYDASQEEYVTENVARENDYKSPVTGKALEQRTEQNYFFKLSKYEDRLLEHINNNPRFIQPDARKNEVLGRIKTHLNDIPISRAVGPDDDDWGVYIPGDSTHRVYVWIDALFNYLTTIDTPERRKYWPASVHLIAKDILWFHAVIWPCILMALDEELPGCIYSHSYWIREGRKMSKSLGNFINLPTIRAYNESFGADAMRYYLLTQGPMGATDADFAHSKFVETYNADLANGIGNSASRVANMIVKYFEGTMPQIDDDASSEFDELVRDNDDLNLEHKVSMSVSFYPVAMKNCQIEHAMSHPSALVRAVDAFINRTEPFKMAKDPSQREKLAIVLTNCVRTLKVAAALYFPAMPDKMTDLLKRFGCDLDKNPMSFKQLCVWDSIKPGTTIVKGDALFMRADTDAPAPEPAQTAGAES